MSKKKQSPKRKTSKKQKKTLGVELLKLLGAAPGFPVNLDFQRGTYTLSGHGFCGTVPAEDRFTVTVYGTVHSKRNKYAYPLATIRFNRAEWEKFKKLGDSLINHFKKYRKKSSRKKK